MKKHKHKRIYAFWDKSNDIYRHGKEVKKAYGKTKDYRKPAKWISRRRCGDFVRADMKLSELHPFEDIPLGTG